MDPAQGPAAIEFGRFQVLPHRRELLVDGRVLELGGRAFELLMALIEASGAIVSKDVLLNRVWPDRVVEENSLHVQISALRRAFGAEHDLIRTIAGRGYQFIGKIRAVLPSPDAQPIAAMPQPTPAPSRPPTNLPAPVSELIGREAELNEILALSASHRLVTLTGAGGIGKTRLSYAAARQLLPRFADGVWAVELAPLSDPELVPVTVATALGLELASGTASPLSVANALRSKRLMLVLDNCEHMVEAAAQMAEALLRANPTARVIATSREALRAEGEWVHPVPPLAVPADGSSDGEDPLRYGAVRLFVERACAAASDLSPGAHDLTLIAGICRHIDGIPLAIELAAARAATLGIEGVAALLKDRFQLLAGGRRTAMPRHQTLQATLDWSYELLTEPERVVLRRLAVFASSFSLEAASTVAADAKMRVSDTVDCVTNLIAKSLLTADAARMSVRYRLLETTRAYALEKLVEAGEFNAVARRQAKRYLDIFESVEAKGKSWPTDEWLADYGPRIDNLRAALDWAFSPGGDVSIAVALTAAVVPLWMHLSLMEECRSRVERALAAIAGGVDQDAQCEMQLYAALAASLMYTRGAVPEVGAAGTKALAIAESLGDAEYQLRSLFSLWSLCINSGRQCVGLNLAQRFHSLAAERPDPNDRLIGERMVGTSQYFLGDLHTARRHLARVLADDVAPPQKWQIVRFEVDQWAAARAYLAQILWLQGLPDQAMRTAERSVAEAGATNHAISVGLALALAACPIALFTGDLVAAERYVEMLIEHSTTHELSRWRAFGRSYQGVLAMQRGDLGTGLQLLRAAFDDPASVGSVPRFSVLFLAETLGRAGRIAEELAEIEEAIVRSKRDEERWMIAELLRIKGELFLRREAPGDAVAAEGLFRQALDRAHRQGALSWELRCATSLARLWYGQARRDEALQLLASVYERFTEGFDTADLKAAKALLDELS